MKLLLLGDQRRGRRFLAWGFGEAPYQLTAAGSGPEVSHSLSSDAFHVACLDLKLPSARGRELLATVRREAPRLPVIALVPDQGGPAGSAELRDQGVRAQLGVPFAVEALRRLLQAHALRDPVGAPRSGPAASAVAPAASRPVVHDDVARRLLGLAMRAAGSPASILLLGETGTGKTALARAIHEGSPRRAGPFVTVSCPCLGRELLESELFGHVRGAFTGALQDARGKVAAAEGGTLFLDEIGDLPLPLQPKLLRLLQERQYERVGETESRSADVRIVAATNRDLRAEVAAGRFREDLYFRLNVIALEAPPLRHRPAQILGAAESFLAAICSQLGRPDPGFSGEARQLLAAHPWPGNFRELRHEVERAVILSEGGPLGPADFPSLRPALARPEVGARVSLAAIERAHLEAVVAACPTLEEAARVLAIDASTLYRRRRALAAATMVTTGPADHEVAPSAWLDRGFVPRPSCGP